MIASRMRAIDGPARYLRDREGLLALDQAVLQNDAHSSSFCSYL